MKIYEQQFLVVFDFDFEFLNLQSEIKFGYKLQKRDYFFFFLKYKMMRLKK